MSAGRYDPGTEKVCPSSTPPSGTTTVNSCPDESSAWKEYPPGKLAGETTEIMGTAWAAGMGSEVSAASSMNPSMPPAASTIAYSTLEALVVMLVNVMG